MIELDRNNPDHRLVLDLTAAAMSMGYNPSTEAAATDILRAQAAIVERIDELREPTA